MERFLLFCDVSVNPQLQVGVGAVLLLPAALLDLPSSSSDRAALAGQLQFRPFIATSSSPCEVETVLWGLDLYRSSFPKATRGALSLYTDSQAVAALPGRRARLEERSFLAKRSGRLLAHAPLYAKLYAASDELDFAIVKVAGHGRAALRAPHQQLFALVDQGARRKLAAGDLFSTDLMRR